MARSGQITVTTAGTQVLGPSTPESARFAVKAHPDNTDTAWVRSLGDTSKGFPMNPGEGIVLNGNTLAAYEFDSDVNGGKVCWMVIQS